MINTLNTQVIEVREKKLCMMDSAIRAVCIMQNEC